MLSLIPITQARLEAMLFDLMVAVYPDGRAYLWRQLNERGSVVEASGHLSGTGEGKPGLSDPAGAGQRDEP